MPRLRSDAARLTLAAEAAADAAGGIIRRHFRQVPDAELKPDASPVTVADRLAERAMRDILAAAFPDHAVLGEEEGESGAGAAFRWVLDPIDGTRAFITGRPVFATLIALLHEERPVLGLIDQPITGERWMGVAGEATRFRGAFGRAGVRRCLALDAAELSCTSPELLGAALPRFHRLAAACRRTSWGGDAYAYGLLALGQIDVIAEAGLKLWDWAALVPIIEGAGGRIADWQGRRLHPGLTQSDVLAVGDPGLLEAAVARLAS